jgi:putative phage-type endonuclease
MTLFISDLEPLEDILDSLVFEEEPSIFTEEYTVDLIETALHLMEEVMKENPALISEPDFHDQLLEEIQDLFYIQMEEHILDDNSETIEDDMNDILEIAFKLYVSTFHPERSINNQNDFGDFGNIAYDNVEVNTDTDLNIYSNDQNSDNSNLIIEEKINRLRNIPQPVQRTPEWYQFRWNLITASNAWKAFESQSMMNQLIYEKCQPLKDFTSEPHDEEVKFINTNTTLHWGQKYEPLSVMFYEHLYESKVEDFGCIQHSVYKFIGASPDGIVVESSSGRYGRMLEIKNIVNREITGIPKKEYWVQMQLQMEVCDLDECDFLETKFTEYPDHSSYLNDSSTAIYNDKVFNSFTTTKDGDYKGIIIHFYKKDGTPHYEYMPLHLWTPHDITYWEETMVQKYELEPYNYTFLKFIYWKLEKLSCVLVLRNRDWFKNNIGQLEKVWNIIEQERITGYEHRAPAKKTRKEPSVKQYVNSYKDDTCFLKVIKS